MCSLGKNWQQPIIGLNNGLVPNKIYASLYLNDLTEIERDM